MSPVYVSKTLKLVQATLVAIDHMYMGINSRRGALKKAPASTYIWRMTLSAIYDKGKKTSVQLSYKQSRLIRDAADILFKSDATVDEVINAVAMLFLMLYGGKTASFQASTCVLISKI